MNAKRTVAIADIAKRLTRLPQGDFDRVLAFLEAIEKQRQGKRKARSDRLRKPLDESWRVGN